jgi:flagellar hook-basal body complex protein FliE
VTAPISALGAIGGPERIAPIATDRAADVGGVVEAGGDFATKLAEGLEQVQGMQEKTNDLSVQAATGSLSDVHDYMIASAESGIATSLTVAVRNKAVEAFQEIMRMQA